MRVNIFIKCGACGEYVLNIGELGISEFIGLTFWQNILPRKEVYKFR